MGRRVIGRIRDGAVQFVDMSAAERDTWLQKRRNASRRASTRALARPRRPRGVPKPVSQLAHEQPEIQAANLQKQALEDVAVSAQVHAAQPPGSGEMRIGTFEAFTAPTQEPLPARAANPPPVGIYGVTGHVLPAPVAPPALWLRHVTADPTSANVTSVWLLW